jgi:N-acetylglucosaminyl-diphospho-decaprenol L-rhamnosyltransferase
MNSVNPKTSSPLITLSIISHGDLEKVLSLLKSVQCYEEEHHLEIIITDNLGQDFTKMDTSVWASLTILRNKQPSGFAHNHNQAFKIATGKYFCVLNPDILFTGAIFFSLIKRLEKDAAIISPLIVDANNRLQDSFRNFPSPLSLLKRKLPGYRFSPLPPDDLGLIHPNWIAGMFMLMQRENYQQLGGFDEKFHLYFEDVDLCARARNLGFLPLVDTNLHIQHDAQRSSRKSFRYLLWHIQSAIQFFRSKVYKDLKR